MVLIRFPHSPAVMQHPLRRWRLRLIATLLLGLAVAASWRYPGYLRIAAIRAGLAQAGTVQGTLAEFGAQSERRFAGPCRDAGIPWPPPRVRLLAFKEERRLEVWVAAVAGRFVRATTYPILGASGGPGPKRRAGDRQVPEGFYRIPVLNADSRYHLSVLVDYPNEEDLAYAIVPRERMGGDIYVHGGSASIGCLAIGDGPIEELFCLLARVPAERREIWIAPVDLRVRNDCPAPDAWVGDLYRRLRERMTECPGGG